MAEPAYQSFAAVNAALRAAGEPTRLRILALLAETELTVSDLTELLAQSQPRISRHLKLLLQAGLIDRFREGAWAFFRLAEMRGNPTIVRDILARLDPADPVLVRDRERLSAVRAARAIAAQAYFRRHASEWDRLRRLHITDEVVEDMVRALVADRPYRSLLDLGTGTGRMLEVLGSNVERGLGLDLSVEMLAIARARLDRAGLRQCSVRQGDINNLALPDDSFDLVVVHQVLHYLDDGARAIREAARVLRPGGRVLVVDFAPHDLEFLREHHAHRRLGFPEETVAQWMRAAGLDMAAYQSLAPDVGSDGKLTVSFWLARDPRIAFPVRREAA
jgi:ubiquinone/menaquinone biosynthesis C-methylase UbiE